jgi:hypothetical protein
VAERWKLVVRDGPTVRKSIHPTLGEALDGLQAETAEAANRAPAREVDLRFRSYGPEDRVVMRAEVKGPQRHFAKVTAGIDVRGDNRLEPWLGGAARSEVEVRKGETAWQALRRALGLG